jgi:hypothetical protein
MSFTLDLTEDTEALLPSQLLNDWLPIRGKSVFHLFSFNKYPSTNTNFTIPSDFGPVLHEDVIMDFNFDNLLQLGPPVNSSATKAYHAAIKSAKHKVHSVTLTPHSGLGNPVTLPTWIFGYWRELELAVSYREQWKAALLWLQSYSGSPATAGDCQNILMALSFFPWSGNNVSIQDITSLLSECPPHSYLSSFHIDYVIGKISGMRQDLRGPEFSRRHIITTVDILGTISLFYGSRRTPTKAGNSLWECLMRIENQIIEGKVDSVGGVYYLPLHWVSVIFNIQEGCILYGDSLGQPLPKQELHGFTQWIKHLRRRSNQDLGDSPVPIYSLSTGHQNDGASCGLFALNAISHHYLGDPLLSTDTTSLVKNRMEIALDLLHKNTV